MVPDLDSDEAQKTVNDLHAFENFCFAYLGMGAGRGTEVVEIPDYSFGEMQVLFELLRYQMKSNKNEKHGSSRNEMVDHYLRFAEIASQLGPLLLARGPS